MNNDYIMNNIYKNNIYERYKDLKNSNKKEFDNNDLWKIFEYYSRIKCLEMILVQIVAILDSKFIAINKSEVLNETYNNKIDLIYEILNDTSIDNKFKKNFEKFYTQLQDTNSKYQHQDKKYDNLRLYYGTNEFYYLQQFK